MNNSIRWCSLSALLVSLAIMVVAQSRVPSGANAGQDEIPVIFACPMHPDVQSSQPGMCPRCRMTLVAQMPDRIEYPLTLRLTPKVPRPGQPLQLAFTVNDPKTGDQVTDFQAIHEKLYHIFIVSQDLQYFVHGHGEQAANGVFLFTATFPRPGMYRALSDFYPKGGTPQLIPKTILVPGAAIAPGVELKGDWEPKQSGNLKVSLTVQPSQPVAGAKTLLFFHLDRADGLEPYLGAWAHMLAASDDLVDMMHDHPSIADGGPNMQFNMIFPRPRVYRIWVQFQKKGVVHTVAFNIPVSDSSATPTAQSRPGL